MSRNRNGIGMILFIMLFVIIGGCTAKMEPKAEETAATSTPTITVDIVEASPLQSSEIEKKTFHSKALDQDMRMNVYLPKGYSKSQTYPVLYIMHGYSGSETGWMPDLGLNAVADQLIESGKIVPLIIVAPQLDNSYGINSDPTYSVTNPSDPFTSYYGMYEDYIYKDVIEYVDAHYSTIANREGRYIGGSSMGGFISLHTAFLHKELFSKVGGHSPALFLNDWSTTGGENGLKAFLYPTDEERKARDPLIFAEDLDLSGLKVFLDCGDQDENGFYKGAQQMYTLLKAKGVEVEYHHSDGKHDAEYIKPMMDDYLIFYAGKSM
jgi:enterochelin esterase-like enzyme